MVKPGCKLVLRGGLNIMRAQLLMDCNSSPPPAVSVIHYNMLSLLYSLLLLQGTHPGVNVILLHYIVATH